MDQSLFGSFSSDGGVPLSSDINIFSGKSLIPETPIPPKIALVRLEFDQLEIPFERVVGNLEGSIRDRLATLDVELRRKIVETEAVSANWKGDVSNSNSTNLLDVINGRQWFEAQEEAKAANEVLIAVFEAGDPSNNKDVLEKIRQHTDDYIKSIEVLSPNSVNDRFVRNSSFGLAALNAAKTDRDEVSTLVISGRDPDILLPRVQKMENQIKLWKASVAFYQDAAGEVRPNKFCKHRDKKNKITDLKKGGLLKKESASVLAELEKEMKASIIRIKEAAKGLEKSINPFAEEEVENSISGISSDKASETKSKEESGKNAPTKPSGG